MNKAVGLALFIPILFCACFEARSPIESVRLAGGLEIPVSSFTPIYGATDLDYSDWEVGRPGGDAAVCLASAPGTFNAVTAAEDAAFDIINRVFCAPVHRNSLTLGWEGELCESWEIAEDNLSAVFTMREGLLWSDGRPLTADDVVFTVNELILNEEINSPLRDIFRLGSEFAKVEFLDKFRFEVTLPKAYKGLLNMVSFPVMPRHIIEPYIADYGHGAFNSYWGADTDVSEIVGSGPFLIREYVPGRRIILEKNPVYWRKDSAGNRLPYLDSITCLIVEDRNEALQKFQAGDTHMYNLRDEDFAVLANRKNELEIELYNAGPSPETTFLVFNQNYETVQEPKVSWFNDSDFRKAMAHLIDREAIIRDVQSGFGDPQYSFIPSASPYYRPDASLMYPDYNPKAAGDILDDMDLTDRNGDGVREDENGNRVTFLLQTNSDNDNRVGIAEMFVREAKAVGVDVIFKTENFNTLTKSLLETYRWDAMITGLSSSVDPVSGASVYPSSGRLHLTEPLQESPRRDWEKRADRWWSNTTLTLDENRWVKGYMELQGIWAEELPWIFLTVNVELYAASNRLGNIKPVPAMDGLFGICERLYFK